MHPKMLNMNLSTMKKVRLIGICILALMLGVGLGSCSKDEYQSRLRELIIKDVEFDASGGDYTKEFRNEDLSNYKATADASWCTVVLDATTSKMTVTVEDNESFDSRSSIVTLQDVKDGATSRTFTVKQGQKNCIQTGVGTYTVGTDGGEVVIEVESNIDYTVSIEKGCDWITRPTSATRGLVKSTVVLAVARNTSEKERSATVTLENTTTGDKVPILITQEFKPYFNLIQTEFTISELGGELNVYIQTNLNSFDCYTDENDKWIKKSGREAVSGDLNTIVQKLSVAAFKEKEPNRSTVVNFQNASYNISKDITITQNRMLYIKDDNFKMFAGDSLKLSIYNKTGNAVLWTSADETIATVDGEGMVKGVDSGSTEIKVTSSDGLYSDYITVTVEKPVDLQDKLAYEWQNGFTVIDGVSVLTSIACTITNNSEFDLMLTKVTCYQEDAVLGYINYNASSGSFNVGVSKPAKFDVAVEYEEEEEKPSEETTNDSTNTDDSSSSGTRGDDTNENKKPKVNTHTYTFVWEYTYKNEKFVYKCVDPEKNTKASARKTSKKSRRR